MTDKIKQIAGIGSANDTAMQTATHLFTSETKKDEIDTQDHDDNDDNKVTEIALEVIPSGSVDGIITREQTYFAEPEKLEKAIFSPIIDKQIAVDDEYQWLIDKELQAITEHVFGLREYKDIAFLLFLFIVGLILIGVSNEGYSVGIIGELIFGAGFIPCLMSSWSLGVGAKGDQYKRDNIIRVFSGSLLSVIGTIVMAIGNEDWLNECGQVLCEVGTLFIISRLFFLREDSECENERLKIELAQSKDALGTGLAHAFFHNFLKPLVKDLCNLNTPNDENGKENEFGKKIIKLNGIDEEYLLREQIFTVFIPRTLNQYKITEEEKKLGKLGQFKYFASHRAFGVRFLRPELSKTDNKYYVSGMCTFPTIIASIYSRYKKSQQDKEKATTRKERDSILDVNVTQEVLDFQNALIKLINNDWEFKNKGLIEHVRIISIKQMPLTDNDIDHMWHAIQKAQKQEDVPKQTQTLHYKRR